MMHKAGQNIAQQQWDEVGRRTGLVPERKFKHKLGEIYVADGYVLWHQDMQEPHWLTSWAIARGEGNIKAFAYFRSKLKSSKPDRITAARQEAEQALKAAYAHEELRGERAKLRDAIVAGEA